LPEDEGVNGVVFFVVVSFLERVVVPDISFLLS